MHNDGAIQAEIAASLGRTRGSVANKVAQLVELGLIQEHGLGYRADDPPDFTRSFREPPFVPLRDEHGLEVCR